MEGSVQCSLKQLTYSHEGHRLLIWGLRAVCRLLQVVAVYTALICASWTVPSFYNRISETTQTLSFTLVDMAASSLQHRPESISASRKVNKVTLAEGKDENITVTVPTESAHVPLSQNVVIETDSIGAVDSESESGAGEQQVTQNYIVRAEPKLPTVNTEDKSTKVEDIGTVVEDIPIKVEDKHDKVKPEKDAEEPNKVSVDDVETKVNIKVEGIVGAPETAEVREKIADEGSSNEDIPSFSEWAQKQLAEAEKKNVQNASFLSAGGNVKKLRSKNYASPDCGAKIVTANPEAGSASSVLSPSRDEYMLNTCTSRIWFIVELCEAVQAKKIDLANFELFSSSPKEFTVFVSDRFPSRDWQSVGHFNALDERNVQSFDLHPHLFGKYIKVELHTHYGSEHFCPISLFRVYGTSEFEVLETEDEVLERVPDVEDDDDDEESLDVMEPGDAPKNLFGSARDAVLSIVKKAAEALGQSGSPQNLTSVSEIFEDVIPVIVADRSEWCSSPSHIVVCDNCSDALFSKVFQLLSCRRHYLNSLIDLPLVHESIRRSELCADYGLNFVRRKICAPYPRRPRKNGVDHRRYGRTGFLSAVFPPEYIAALCNVLAVAEKKVVLNISYENMEALPLNLTAESNVTSPENTVFHEYLVTPQTTCTADVGQTSQLELTSTSSLTSGSPLIKEKSSNSDVESIASKIKPTRTLSRNGYHGREFSDSGSVSQVDSTEIQSVITGKVAQTDSTSSTVVASVFPDNHSVTEPVPETLGAKTQRVEAVVETQLFPEDSDGSAEIYSEEPDLSLDTLLSELKDLDIDTSSASSSVSSSISPPNIVQKESVFLRLSNRIKALERNMSLSGQYLEELSRRYKRQMEEMQRAFDRSLAVIAEESRKGAEREQKQAEMLATLQRQVAALSSAVETLAAEQSSWQHKVFHPSSLMLLFLTAFMIYFTCRNQAPLPDEHNNSSSVKMRKPKRRKSAEGLIGHVSGESLGKRRRPSEEALNILGTYRDLLISEQVTTEIGGGKMTTLEGKRKKRRKKDSMVKSLSSHDEPKFRRRSDSSSVSPVIAAEGEVVPRRASFSAVRSYSSPNERTIVCIEEQDGVEHVEAGIVPGDRIDYTTVTNVDHTTGLCNSINCVDNKKHADTPDSIVPVDVVVDSRDMRTTVANQVPRKTGPGRIVNGTDTQPSRLSAPSYMKTALSARNSRKLSSQSVPEPGQQAKLKSDNWRKLYRSSQLSLPVLQARTNGNTDAKEMHRFNSTSEVDREHSVKKGSSGGLKKMVKRFFE